MLKFTYSVLLREAMSHGGTVKYVFFISSIQLVGITFAIFVSQITDSPLDIE